MKRNLLVSSRSTATILAVGLAAAITTAKEIRADALSDLLGGKKVSVSMQCPYPSLPGFDSRVSLNSRGNLMFESKETAKPVEIVNGEGRMSIGYGIVWRYSATVSGNKLTVSRNDEGDTVTMQISGDACSATYTAGKFLGEIDFSRCRVVRCTVASAPTVATSSPPPPTTLFREVDCNQRFPGETGLGLYLKGKYRATCTVERSYHDRDDAKKKQIIRVTACARSDSEMQVRPLARMRARDYAFSLALKSLPRPEMDSGGDKDIGCGK